ncbi:phage protein NinX family protein [Pantoea dispersa]|uniref:phage protein NinX family protein n=1 Tax=Pantoea dispersa TaxID=59814 RepID=UPI0032EF6E43
MNYSEMSDAQINDAVAIARGSLIRKGKALSLYQVEGADLCTDFCNSWADAGPIIAANKISLDFDADGYEPPQNAWCKASSPCGQVYYGGESEPLRAAMIVFLMMQEKPDVA